jgi:transposase
MWSTNRMPIDNSAMRVSLRGTSVGLDVHALSVVAHAVDEVTGEVSRARLCPDHGEIFCWLSLVRAPVRVVYGAGSPGGCSGGSGG